MATAAPNPLCLEVYSPEMITRDKKFGFITPKDMRLYLPKALDILNGERPKEAITIAFITNDESLPEC